LREAAADSSCSLDALPETAEEKMTIDERLDALTTNLEVMSGMMRDMLAAEERRAAREEALAARERQLRTALLRGIVTFLEGLEPG
jgi:hypothetical protein